MTEVPPGRPCECPDCECVNDADIQFENSERALCGCCIADCPDVHGPQGKTWRFTRPLRQ